MKRADTIRWLHLSDFHVGKDKYGQEQFFKEILKSVREKVKAGQAPDMVFITGDIANMGKPDEYKLFHEKFFLSLMAELGYSDNIFLIPGNHDVDRSKAKFAAHYDVLSTTAQSFDASMEGAEHRDSLRPRFEAYIGAAMNNRIAVKSTWLSSPEGTYTHILTIRGHRIGILGINTAWLSLGDEDRHKMTPGKFLVQAGLEKLEEAGCETKIVLGHHPIDWYTDDDIEPIRSRLGQNNAIYLHGHLHRTSGRHEEGGGHPFLTIQAGASFQAREDERWVNQILWCELNYTKKRIEVEPLRWSGTHQQWIVNTDAFPPPAQKPNALRWLLRLPGDTPGESNIDEDMPDLPGEWIYVDRQFLEQESHKKPNDEQVIRFFDGSDPSWQTILSPKLQSLSMATSLVQTLEQARLKGGPGVTVLLGPVGEGKTTILKQVVCQLIKNSTEWRVLWRDDEDTMTSLDFIWELPQIEGTTWLIVSDEASNIASKVHAIVSSLHKQERRDIQFLLCCRDTDWIAASADRLPWNRFTLHYEKKKLSGLSREDARKVVENWSHFGERGLGELSKMPQYSLDKAVNRLEKAAQRNEPSKEGSFLGAMLDVRFGEGLKEHVKTILERLQQNTIRGGTLLEAFVYIAAFHSKNAELITREVLATKFDYEIGEVKTYITGPLGEEAPLSKSGEYILTRHARIAQATVEILAEPPFHLDIDEKYIINLVLTIVQAYEDNPTLFGEDIAKWRFLSSSIFNLHSKERDKHKRNEEDRHNKELAVRLARALIKKYPNNGHYVVNLSQLLTRSGKPEQGADLFRTAKMPWKDRAYYFAWGVSEGRAGNHALDAWLAAVSLADGTERNLPDHERIKKSLTGLSTAFAKLFDKYKNDKEKRTVFISACAGATQLGLSLHYLDPKTLETLQEAQQKCKDNGVDEKMSPSIAFHWLLEGIQAAWQYREADLEGLTRGDQLTFESLAQRLGV